MNIIKSNVGSLAVLLMAIALTIVFLSIEGCDSSVIQPPADAEQSDASVEDVENDAGTDTEPGEQCVGQDTGESCDIPEGSLVDVNQLEPMNLVDAGKTELTIVD